MAITAAGLTACDKSTAPDVAGTINIASGDQQSVVVGSAVASPLVVTVIDEHGRPMVGAKVTWVIQSGDGSLSSTSTDTDGNGQASVLYTAGSDVGTTMIAAEVAGIDSILLVDFSISVVAAADGT
jgi:hypothetical protein